MKEDGWQVYLRLVTPIVGFIVMFLVMTVKGDIARIEGTVHDMDTKLFKHITNDELHCPRSVMLPRAEFAIYNDNITRWMQSISNEMVEIKNYILNKEIKMNRR